MRLKQINNTEKPKKSRLCVPYTWGGFFATLVLKKEGVEMESYDNDGLLLFLDDDLFPVAEDPEENESVD